MLRRKLILSFIAVFVLLSFSFVVSVDADSVMWSQTYGGENIELAQSLVETSDGGYAIAGDTSSFGGTSDFWFVKTDEFGNMEWNQTYGGSASDSASSLVTTSDEGYAIAGDTHSFGAGGSDFWLVKTDSSGNMQWNKTYGGTSYDNAYSLVQTGDGGYAIAGSTQSYGAGESDFWLVKTDASGNMEWNQTYGGENAEQANSLVTTSDGGYAIAGSTYPIAGTSDFWFVKTDEFGNMEWNQTYGGEINEDAYALVTTSDGGYAIAGSTSSFGAGTYDFWLVKTDSHGNVVWDRTYGMEGGEEANSLVTTSDEGYAIAGYTYSFGTGDSDVWLVKTDASGNMEWNKAYGDEDFMDEASSLIATSDGGYAIAVYTHSFGAGGSDFWLVKTDETGVYSEVSSWLIPLLLLTATLLLIATLVIVIYKKKLFHHFHRLDNR